MSEEKKNPENEDIMKAAEEVIHSAEKSSESPAPT